MSEPNESPAEATVDVSRIVEIIAVYNQIKAASTIEQLALLADSDRFSPARWLFLRNNLRLITLPVEDNV